MNLSDAAITASARRHGVIDDDIRHALRNWIGISEQDEEVTLLLGPDTAGNLIEVGVVADDDGTRIIHAMRPARPHKFSTEG